MFLRWNVVLFQYLGVWLMDKIAVFSTVEYKRNVKIFRFLLKMELILNTLESFI